MMPIGDINLDGVVNVMDVIMLVENVLSGKKLTPTQLHLADINKDGVVNTLDILKLVELILVKGNVTQKQRNQLNNQLSRINFLIGTDDYLEIGEI
jgi:hypothetical protein